MTFDQVLPAAILAAIVILVLAGIVRVATRRPAEHEDRFGAGGTTVVPTGSHGVAETDLTPAGNVRAVGESWSARAAGGRTIPAGTDVRVVEHDGLTLIVEAVPKAGPAEE